MSDQKYSVTCPDCLQEVYGYGSTIVEACKHAEVRLDEHLQNDCLGDPKLAIVK
jgi:hypothetical protein